MDELAITSTLARVLDDQLGRKDISPEDKLVDDLGIDSLGMIALIQAVEQAFTIEIADEDTEGIVTVQDLINYLVRRKS